MKKVQKRKPRAGLFLSLIAYALILVVLTILNEIGSDRWWFGAVYLYLPQALWLLPLVPLTLFSLKYARRWIWVQGVFLLWVCGPIMGFHWNFRGQTPPNTHETVIRVMTCNIKFGLRDISELMKDMALYQPDVVFLQEASNMLYGPLGDFFRGWNAEAIDQYLILSRLPLSKAEVRWMSFPGEEWPCLRTQVHVGQTPVTLYNVHFLTPRQGFKDFRAARRKPGLLPEAIQTLQDNVENRLIQARKISDLIRQEQGPVMVAGDLNSSDASEACETLREAGLHDAFAESGRGYGYTYGHFLLRNRLPWIRNSWVRIDHIMLSKQLRSLRCWTGTGKASDHRPVIADVIVTTPYTDAIKETDSPQRHKEHRGH